MKEYEITRAGKKYIFLDTIGLSDSHDSDDEDASEFTDE